MSEFKRCAFCQSICNPVAPENKPEMLYHIAVCEYCVAEFMTCNAPLKTLQTKEADNERR